MYSEEEPKNGEAGVGGVRGAWEGFKRCHEKQATRVVELRRSKA